MVRTPAQMAVRDRGDHRQVRVSLLPATLLFPSRTLSGDGAILRLGAEAASFGRRGVLVHGRSLAASGRLAGILDALPAGIAVTCHEHAGGEPTTDDVERLRLCLRAGPADWVAAVGGGSAIDLAKAAAGLRDAPGAVDAYHGGLAIPPAALPLIAAPTTAGTGSEATTVAVLTRPAGNVKLGIRHPTFLPRLVILDPGLLRGCPPATIAAAGMDAFVQAFESLTSRFATPFTRALSELALARIAAALPAAYGGDFAAAPDLLEGSFAAGLALSHARLGVVHGLAHPLGARWHAAHGLVCAACFPAALRFNRGVAAADLARLRGLLGMEVEEWVAAACGRMGLASPFRGAALCAADRAAVVSETLASGSTAANPRTVAAADVEALLAEIFAGA
jgi:alcohol dehydrogenase class IV